MSRITVEYTSGKKETFEETSRAGGSWCTSIRYSNGWAIITDAYGKETAIPASQVKKITEENTRCRW